ncbi:MAG: hypothetical protein R6U32_06400 [Candidatus Woesearchaeota archaeon]
MFLTGFQVVTHGSREAARWGTGNQYSTAAPRTGLTLGMFAGAEDKGEAEDVFANIEKSIRKGIYQPIVTKAVNLMVDGISEEWDNLDTDIFATPAADQLEKVYKSALEKMRFEPSGDLEDELAEIQPAGEKIQGVIDYINQINELTDGFDQALNPLSEYEKQQNEITSSYDQARAVLQSLGVEIEKTSLAAAEAAEQERLRREMIVSPIMSSQLKFDKLFNRDLNVEAFMRMLGLDYGSLGVADYLRDTDFNKLTSGRDRLNQLLREGQIEQDTYNTLFSELISQFKESQNATEEATRSEEALFNARKQASQSIDDLIARLQGGTLAPVQSMEFFENQYFDKLAAAREAKGTEEYGQKVSDLTSFIPQGLEFAAAYGGNYRDVYEGVLGNLRGLQGYAGGGYADGWSLVGERGPEIINTSGKVSSNEDTVKMITDAISNAMSGGGGQPIIKIYVGGNEIRDYHVEWHRNDDETHEAVRREVA